MFEHTWRVEFVLSYFSLFVDMGKCWIFCWHLYFWVVASLSGICAHQSRRFFTCVGFLIWAATQQTSGAGTMGCNQVWWPVAASWARVRPGHGIQGGYASLCPYFCWWSNTCRSSMDYSNMALSKKGCHHLWPSVRVEHDFQTVGWNGGYPTFYQIPKWTSTRMYQICHQKRPKRHNCYVQALIT